jgi:hypothetical protein
MLSITFRVFRREALFRPIAEAPKTAAQDFFVEEMKSCVARWRENEYIELKSA